MLENVNNPKFEIEELKAEIKKSDEIAAWVDKAVQSYLQQDMDGFEQALETTHVLFERDTDVVVHRQILKQTLRDWAIQKSER